MAIRCITTAPPDEWNCGKRAEIRMSATTWLTALPLPCRDAIARRQAGDPPQAEDASVLADAARWAIWSAMSDDDRDEWTMQLLAWSREAERWGSAG